MHGGMILCFAFHHTALEATSCGTLIQLYAGLCSHSLDEELLAKAKTPRLSASHNLPYEAALHLQGRYVHIEGDGVSPKPAPEAVSSLFRISTVTLQELKATVSASLSHERTGTWTSTLDAVAALIWGCVARARAPLMDVKSTCTLDMAVNARRRVDAPLPEGYLSNCIIGSIVHKPLATCIEKASLPDLAASTRASYSQIYDHLIKAQFTMICAEPDIGLLFSRWPAPPSYLLITSWAAIPLYEDFRSVLGIHENVSIPTGPGQYELRLLQLRNLEMARSLEGMGGGDLEFYLGLEREAMQRLQNDEEWKDWVQLGRG
jgi:hypothetical protein